METFRFNLEDISARCAVNSFILRNEDGVEYISSEVPSLFLLAALGDSRLVYQLLQDEDENLFLLEVQPQYTGS